MTALRRTVAFGLAGVVGLVVDAAVLALLIGVAGPYLARAASFLAAVATTWAINRRLAFADRRSGQSLGAEFASYLGAMLLGGALNYATYANVVFAMGAGGAWPYAGLVGGSLVGMAANLLLARFVIFRHERG